MESVWDIVKAVKRLPPEELEKFCVWFEQFQADCFDCAIDSDSLSGKLDKPADASSRDYRATQSELDGVNRGLRDASDRKFASQQEIDALLQKHRK